MKISIRFTILVLFVSIFPLIATSQTQSEGVENLISESYSIPDIPALDIVSADPDNITRPASVKELATSIYNSIDASGHLKRGIAFEIKPSYFLNSQISLDDYQNSKLDFILQNMQLSFATMATSGDDNKTDLSWGIRVVVYDQTDPMANKGFTKRFASTLSDCAPKVTPGKIVTKTKEEIENDKKLEIKCLEKARKAVLEGFIKENWNAGWLSLAYAGGQRLSGGVLEKGDDIAHQVWVAGGVPIKNWGHLAYQAKWKKERVLDTEKYFKELNFSSRLILKLTKQKINFFAEASLNPLLNKTDFSKDAGVDTDQVFSWSSGFEFFVSKGLWLITGLGENSERIVGNEGIQILSGIRFGISNKQRFK